MAETKKSLLRSGELMRAAGCTRKALRVYQAKNLVAPVREEGMSRYDATARERLRLVVMLRDAGFSLDEICELVPPVQEETDVAGPMANVALDRLSAMIIEVSERQRLLGQTRDKLVRARECLQICRDCPKPLSQCQDCVETERIDGLSFMLLTGATASV